ncbi:hypothetical protein D3C72_1679820 [compost metagenome]
MARSTSPFAAPGCTRCCSRFRCWPLSMRCIFAIRSHSRIGKRAASAWQPRLPPCMRRGWKSSRLPTTARAAALAAAGRKRCCARSLVAWALPPRRRAPESAWASWRAPAICCWPRSWGSRRWAPWRMNTCKPVSRSGRVCAKARSSALRCGPRSTGVTWASRCRTCMAWTPSCATSICISASCLTARAMTAAIRSAGASA